MGADEKEVCYFDFADEEAANRLLGNDITLPAIPLYLGARVDDLLQVIPGRSRLFPRLGSVACSVIPLEGGLLKIIPEDMPDDDPSVRILDAAVVALKFMVQHDDHEYHVATYRLRTSHDG